MKEPESIESDVDPLAEIRRASEEDLELTPEEDREFDDWERSYELDVQECTLERQLRDDAEERERLYRYHFEKVTEWPLWSACGLLLTGEDLQAFVMNMDSVPVGRMHLLPAASKVADPNKPSPVVHLFPIQRELSRSQEIFEDAKRAVLSKELRSREHPIAEFLVFADDFIRWAAEKGYPVPESAPSKLTSDSCQYDAQFSNGFFSAKELAKRHRIPDPKFQSFRKALEKWREMNLLGADYQKHDAPTKNTARWTYRESAVRDVVLKYQE